MTRPASSLVQSQIVQVAADDDFLYFLLGVVAFARTLLDVLGEGRALIQDPPMPAASPVDEPGPLLI